MNGRFFPIQTIHLGRAGTYASFNEPTLPIGGLLGAVVEDAGKVYRLVKFDNGTGNVASAAGGAAHWKTRASFIVTSDQTDHESGVNGIAGGFLGVVTDLYYCFVQIGGLQAVITDGNATKGSCAVGTTTDLTFGNMADGAANWASLPFGIYNADDVSTAGTMYWLLGNVL